MPNHVKTIVRMTGDLGQIKKLKEECFKNIENPTEYGPTRRFDFETIIPMPENIFRGDIGKKEQELYGENNWYDWSISNWGTKWNAYDLAEVGQRIFIINTAWSYPHKIFRALSEKYPHVKFHIRYADEGIYENSGKCTYLGGEKTEYQINDYKRFNNNVWRF